MKRDIYKVQGCVKLSDNDVIDLDGSDNQLEDLLTKIQLGKSVISIDGNGNLGDEADVAVVTYEYRSQRAFVKAEAFDNFLRKIIEKRNRR